MVRVPEVDMVHPSTDSGTEQALGPTGVSVSSSDDVQSVMENSCSDIPSGILDVGNLESGIPGLDSAAHGDRLSEPLVITPLTAPDLEDANQEQLISICRSPLESLPSLSTELLPSMSTDRSEELSPKASVTDVNSINSSTETSVGLSTQFILPKISAPVINLADEQKDDLQKMAFVRIVEAYKSIAVAGGSNVRFSLLAYLGVKVIHNIPFFIAWVILNPKCFSSCATCSGGMWL